MEKQFQFTSKWSNIDSGLKAGPGGSQTQEASLCLLLSDRNTDHYTIYLCLHNASLILCIKSQNP